MKYKINLIGKKSTSFFDKVLYFFLNYLRYILVATQLVVIGVLFFRFQIDQNIIDLKDSIDQKKEIITVVKPILAESEKIKQREDSVRKILASQDNFSAALDYVFSIFPETAILDSLSITEGKYDLKGTTTNPQHLQAYYQKLQKDKRFAKVILSDIGKKEFGYDFSMTLEKFIK